MMKHPVYILVILLLIEGVILALSNRPVGKKLFRFLPSMFWIYFLPMLANTVGILPSENAFYGVIAKWVLPAALVILLLSADIRGILRLGPKALGMMAAAVGGIMIGAPVVVMLYRQWLPAEGWKGIGALSASWIGGSANMIAVKEAIGTPDSVFLPIVIVDTLIPYFWMGLLIAVSTCQYAFDRWNRADVRLLDDLARRGAASRLNIKNDMTMASVLVLAALTIGSSYAAVCLTQRPKHHQSRRMVHYPGDGIGYRAFLYAGAKTRIPRLKYPRVCIAVSCPGLHRRQNQPGAYPGGADPAGRGNHVDRHSCARASGGRPAAQGPDGPGRSGQSGQYRRSRLGAGRRGDLSPGIGLSGAVIGGFR
jgi:hypothetical protein